MFFYLNVAIFHLDCKEIIFRLHLATYGLWFVDEQMVSSAERPNPIHYKWMIQNF